MNSVKLQYTKSTYKNLVFLYTNNKLSTEANEQIITFTHNNKKNKIPRNRLNQRGKRLVTKNRKH